LLDNRAFAFDRKRRSDRQLRRRTDDAALESERLPDQRIICGVGKPAREMTLPDRPCIGAEAGGEDLVDRSAMIDEEGDGLATEPELIWSRVTTIGADTSPRATISLSATPAATRSFSPIQ
jgi:hypothetical protein